MRKLIFILGFSFVFSENNAQVWQWAKVFDYYTCNEFYDALTDSAENIYLLGEKADQNYTVWTGYDSKGVNLNSIQLYGADFADRGTLWEHLKDQAVRVIAVGGGKHTGRIDAAAGGLDLNGQRGEFLGVGNSVPVGVGVNRIRNSVSIRVDRHLFSV